MNILGLASGILKLFNSVAGMIREKNLMDAGAAKQQIKEIAKTKKVMQDARKHTETIRDAMRKRIDHKLLSKWSRKD